MSVIRSLTASRDTKERDREKANLQKEFHESDLRLDKLVLQHHQDLTSVMQAFSKISLRLDSAKNRLQGMREKLTSCQNLLNCKRDDLKRLWLESIENKYILEQLDSIDEQIKVPEKVSSYIEGKRYLHATQLLLNCLSQLNGNLKQIEGLSEIKNDLMTRKEDMFNLLLDDLHKHIYIKSTTEIVKKVVMKRFEAGEKRQGTSSIIDNRPNAGVSVADILSAGLRNPASTARRIPSPVPTDEAIVEDLEIEDPEDDSKHFIAIIIESLSLLDRLPEAVAIIKERADKELGNIVKRTAKEVLESGNNQKTGKSDRSDVHVMNIQGRLHSIPDHLLQEFIDALLTQFRCVADIHETVVLVHLKRVIQGKNTEIETYNMKDIWNKIQSVVEVVADYYSNLSDMKGSSDASSGEADLSSYFVRKKAAGDQTHYHSSKDGSGGNERQRMFRFDLSSPAMIFNAYLEEQQS